DRRAVRAAPTGAVPGTRRQEPDAGDPVRAAGPGGGGRAVRRVRDGRPAVHLARHGDRARVAARRVPGRVLGGGRGGTGRLTDPSEVFAFRRGIGAGMVSVNNSTSGAEAHLPFGGNGRSGNGSRQSGRWVLDQFTRWQAVNWDYSGRLQKAQMDVAELTADLD